MFENTVKTIRTNINNMFNEGLGMYKEMCLKFDEKTQLFKQVSLDNELVKQAWFAMGNLESIYREFSNNICGFTLTALEEHIRQYEKYAKLCDKYHEILKPWLGGTEETRFNALMENEVSIDAEVISVAGAAKRLYEYNKSMVDARADVEQLEMILVRKEQVLNKCLEALKKIYEEFKADQKKKTEETKKPQQKRIIVFIDNSWPMSPRQIQQAIDTLTAFVKVQGEGDGPIEKGIEGLKALKKGVEQDIMDHTKVVQDGMYFKLKVVE